MLRISFATASLIIGVLPTITRCQAASLPSSALPAVTRLIQRDFRSIRKVETYSMSDDTDGQFDIVAVGLGSGHYGGWRVEVLSVGNHQLIKRWDSAVWAKGMEFGVSGLHSIDVRDKDYGYDVVFGGCARHMCADGISGFLVFSGKTGKTYKAKLVTRDLDKTPVDLPKYDVTFSKDISEEARKLLQDEMCASNAISNKQGLPFACGQTRDSR